MLWPTIRGIAVLLPVLFRLSLTGESLAFERHHQLLDCTNSTAGLLPCRSWLAGPGVGQSAGKQDVSGKKNGGPSERNAHRRETSTNELCADGELDGNFKPALVCTPKEQFSGELLTQQLNQVELHIRTANNETQFQLGAPVSIECRVRRPLREGVDLELRWFRSAPMGLHEQAVDSDAPMPLDKVRVVQKDGGMDVKLDHFQVADAGTYFCRAVSPESGSVISEARIELRSASSESEPTASSPGEELSPTPETPIENGLEYIAYSQENLSKLLPSLRIVPEFSELSAGDTIRLVCTTSELDPDPDPSQLKWTFEPLLRRSSLLFKAPADAQELPHNVSVLGNMLVVWSMSAQHCGLYKCTATLTEFNLTSQAVGELYLRPETDSAPLVFVSPEVVRMSPNGSATIQCEATGYPAPSIAWYRVEPAPQPASGGGGPQQAPASTILEEALQREFGIEVERLPYKDSAAYCEQNRCTVGRQRLVSGVSLMRLRQVRAQHQGQYVCRADNRHGSNQASSVVDVEFKEPPLVSIAPEFREQTIVLAPDGLSEQLNVTFKCSVESGRPLPHLRWLRTASNGNGNGHKSLKLDNLDIYDLTKVSSATSNVSTWFEDSQKTLVLSISTISLDDEGDYICLAENEWGRQSALARLFVRKPASVRILQASPMLARINDSFHLDCLASGHPLPLDIEWSRSERGAFFSLISRSSGLQSGQERAVLKFDRVSVDESGEYTCNARDPLNSSSILRDTIMVLVDEARPDSDSEPGGPLSRAQSSLLPKLMVRPTKASVGLGANLTLDCLAVSGLQPTLVEWLAPWQVSLDNASSVGGAHHIRPYYREVGGAGGQLLQFGSKLRLLNVSRQHEGVYQCKGRNRVGVENAPALVKVVEPGEKGEAVSDTDWKQAPVGSEQAKTKVAKVGSNIELKCQVNGVEQPATSWSRDGLELPASSVQIGHNLWIQNVSARDNGLYVCSARSRQPNRVIQARVNLLVRGNSQSARLANLSAKIVASKSSVSAGDSITLECIVSMQNASGVAELDSLKHGDELQEIERQVVWTNLHSGQTLFQDNVYIQNNLLIIYELRPENSATYRCNYNELSQHADYRLLVTGEGAESAGNARQQSEELGRVSQTAAGRLFPVDTRPISVGSQLTLECPGAAQPAGYFWTRGSEARKRVLGHEGRALAFWSIGSADADLYSCHQASSGHLIYSVLVQVLLPVARFAQKPVSFITLPSISGADHQLSIEVKFLPEREHGLLLLNGQHLQVHNGSMAAAGDYISLGLNRGHLEFRFELGDGTTLLRSASPLALNQWHKVLIERNRRGAVMWLDGQPPVSNSSAGKFFNLNLDSVLHVGGSHHFQLGHNKSASSSQPPSQRPFYGYLRGFQGCISLLRIANEEVQLMARNRSVSVGVYECDKPECRHTDCGHPNGLCQVDRSTLEERLESARRASAGADLRCICLPGFSGERCTRPEKLANQTERAPVEWGQPPSGVTPAPRSTSSSTSTSRSASSGACDLLAPCSANGTMECQSLTSTAYKCHCRLGFMGDTCAKMALFASETSVAFSQQAYLRLRFLAPEEMERAASNEQQAFNATDYARLVSMAEQQNVSLSLQTKSSYGLIFYVGQHNALKLDTPASSAESAQLGQLGQTSKSMVANLLTRLSSGPVSDYLALALVDGHIELSYELGSGPAIIRSSRRVNDGERHLVELTRNGRWARLSIDQTHKYEGNSPGRLSMLNVPADMYLGGLPQQLAELGNSTLVSGFAGCISSLEMNTLGPLNLVRSSPPTQLLAARNLAPCQLAQRAKPYLSAPESDDSDEIR